MGTQGRARQGGGGHSRPAPAGPSEGPPLGPSAPTAAAGSACGGGGPAQCLRPPSRPLQADAGGPPSQGGSSPVLRLQAMARTVGLLQVALQLLLPFPVVRLLLAQPLVLQLKSQECFPADREGVSRAGDGSPLGPTGLRQGNWADGAGRGTEARGRAQSDPGVGLEYPGLSGGVGGRGAGGGGAKWAEPRAGSRGGSGQGRATLRWGSGRGKHCKEKRGTGS